LVVFGIATAFAAVIPLPAQIGPAPDQGVIFRPSGVTGAPYCGTQTTESIQTLADGTHITQPGQKTVRCRDSFGRTREEVAFRGVPGDRPAPVFVNILDPVAGFRYQLNSNTKVALRFATPARPAAPTAQPPTVVTGGLAPPAVAGVVGSGKLTAADRAVSLGGASGNPPKTTSESLGTQLIDGMTAEGTRTTTTWPVGTVGNDREIIVTHDRWFSKQLQVEVLTKTSDPRSGDATTKLIDISLVEPDPALFKPPADYKINDVHAAAPNR
jgi:hypothetical protein